MAGLVICQSLDIKAFEREDYTLFSTAPKGINQYKLVLTYSIGVKLNPNQKGRFFPLKTKNDL